MPDGCKPCAALGKRRHFPGKGNDLPDVVPDAAGSLLRATAPSRLRLRDEIGATGSTIDPVFAASGFAATSAATWQHFVRDFDRMVPKRDCP